MTNDRPAQGDAGWDIEITEQVRPTGAIRSLLVAVALGAWEPDTRNAFRVSLKDGSGREWGWRDLAS